MRASRCSASSPSRSARGTDVTPRVRRRAADVGDEDHPPAVVSAASRPATTMVNPPGHAAGRPTGTPARRAAHPPRRPGRLHAVRPLHRAERADALVEALAALLAEPPPDPFAPELVAVPTRGMERWLTQRMSARLGASAGRTDGVGANVEFPSPRAVVGEAVAAASGLDPAADPWLPERAVWPLLELVDSSLGEAWLARLAAHLGVTANGRDPGRAAR